MLLLSPVEERDMTSAAAFCHPTVVRSVTQTQQMMVMRQQHLCLQSLRQTVLNFCGCLTT